MNKIHTENAITKTGRKDKKTGEYKSRSLILPLGVREQAHLDTIKKPEIIYCLPDAKERRLYPGVRAFVAICDLTDAKKG